jgi:hypothetical protein
MWVPYFHSPIHLHGMVLKYRGSFTFYLLHDSSKVFHVLNFHLLSKMFMAMKGIVSSVLEIPVFNLVCYETTYLSQ